MMEMKLQGFDRLIRAFDKAPRYVARELTAWMTSTGFHMQGEVQQRTPKRDGTLQASIGMEVEQTGTLGVTAVVGTPLNYAVPVELGTKPHVIEPKDAQALHFMMRGVPVFAKKVHHPGTKGAFMFDRAYKENMQQVVDDFGRLVEHIVTNVAKGAV